MSPTNFYDPDHFIPERWLPEAKNNPSSPFFSDNRDVLQPFSTGPRNCIGKNLAYAEMRVILARVLWNFDLQLCEESLDWKDQETYALWNKRPLMCKLVRRVGSEANKERVRTTLVSLWVALNDGLGMQGWDTTLEEDLTNDSCFRLFYWYWIVYLFLVLSWRFILLFIWTMINIRHQTTQRYLVIHLHIKHSGEETLRLIWNRKRGIKKKKIRN